MRTILLNFIPKVLQDYSVVRQIERLDFGEYINKISLLASIMLFGDLLFLHFIWVLRTNDLFEKKKKEKRLDERLRNNRSYVVFLINWSMHSTTQPISGSPIDSYMAYKWFVNGSFYKMGRLPILFKSIPISSLLCLSI